MNEALELAETIAGCVHEAKLFHRGTEIEWCPKCGAARTRIVGCIDPDRWLLPETSMRAKEIDATANPRDQPAAAPASDSGPKIVH